MDRTATVGPVEPLIAEVVQELPDVEAIAAGCSVPLLITAASESAVDAIARRVHAASSRASYPLVHQRAGALPAEPSGLDEFYSALLEAANGGSLLLSDVEEMPAIVQARLIDLLAEMHRAGQAAAVRVIAGTTVSLWERIVHGTFSESLFYRLNIVHIMVNNRAGDRTRRTRAGTAAAFKGTPPEPRHQADVT